MPLDDPDLTLEDAAECLGVHYMTAYRYVRTGRLRGVKRGRRWSIDRAELDRFASSAPAAPGRPRGSASPGDACDRLRARFLAGDEAGAWSIVEESLVGGLEPQEVLLDLVAGAMRSVGEAWELGEVTVAGEHRATAVASRIIGRLGPRFVRRGPTIGAVVLGAPAGDRHSLPSAILRDLLRTRGFDVIDLGGDVPPWCWAEAIAQITSPGTLVATGICVSTPHLDEPVAEAIAAVRAATSAPIVLGGIARPPGVQVDHVTDHADEAIEAFRTCLDGHPVPQTACRHAAPPATC